MHIGAGEVAVIIVLALVLFGAKRLPQLGRAVGEAIREFKAAFDGKSGDKPEGKSEAVSKTSSEGEPSADTKTDEQPRTE